MTKLFKIFSFGILAALFFGVPTEARAFHDGGVASCETCHTAHNSYQGAPMTQNAQPVDQANAYLLQNGSASAVCLNCHESSTLSSDAVSTSQSVLAPGVPPVQLTPGGDFAWLKKTYSWTSGGTNYSENGERHGHNIVCPEYGYVEDSTYTTAPGGTYPSADLQCTSCHDPHGRYRILADGSTATSGLPIAASGSESANGVATNPTSSYAVGTYRLLAGKGYQPSSSLPAFTADPPAAISPPDCNRPETTTQTRVAYGSGMSAWCGNCHGQFHSTGATFVHPSGSAALLGTTITDRYNAYVKTGDLTGSSSKSYVSLVPFEMGLGDSATDRNAMAAVAKTDDSALGGPDANSRVSCLTCHRAHASGWDHMLRWNNDSSLLVVNGAWPGIDNGAPADDAMGRTEAETRKAYYDRPATEFATDQNPLCEKCHP